MDTLAEQSKSEVLKALLAYAQNPNCPAFTASTILDEVDKYKNGEQTMFIQDRFISATADAVSFERISDNPVQYSYAFRNVGFEGTLFGSRVFTGTITANDPFPLKNELEMLSAAKFDLVLGNFVGASSIVADLKKMFE